jgi:hypothetical protein
MPLTAAATERPERLPLILRGRPALALGKAIAPSNLNLRREQSESSEGFRMLAGAPDPAPPELAAHQAKPLYLPGMATRVASVKDPSAAGPTGPAWRMAPG